MPLLLAIKLDILRKNGSELSCCLACLRRMDALGRKLTDWFQRDPIGQVTFHHQLLPDCKVACPVPAWCIDQNSPPLRRLRIEHQSPPDSPPLDMGNCENQCSAMLGAFDVWHCAITRKNSNMFSYVKIAVSPLLAPFTHSSLFADGC